VNAIVSNRIYPMVLAQKATLPAIRYQRISGIPEHSHDGVSGFEVAVMQVDCYAETYLGAIALRDAVQAGMDGFNGTRRQHSPSCCRTISMPTKRRRAPSASSSIFLCSANTKVR
jgi:hypothetical protein